MNTITTKTIIYGFISIMCLIVFLGTAFMQDQDVTQIISTLLLTLFVGLTYNSNSFKKA